jgi:hypothetical protein
MGREVLSRTKRRVPKAHGADAGFRLRLYEASIEEFDELTLSVYGREVQELAHAAIE